MSFEHLKNFEGMMNFKASSICTSWGEIKTSEYFDGYPNYDYFPIMKNGSVLGLVIRAEGGSKEEVHFKGTKLFLNKETDILEVIYRFYDNYKHNVELEKPGLLILVDKDKPSGILTLADLNHEQVSALIWRIIKNVEVILKNNLGEITYDIMLDELGKKRADDIKKWVSNDENNKVELGYTNYLSLSDILNILKSKRNYCPLLTEVTKDHLTKQIINLRNKVSHHRVGKSLISKSEDIIKFYNTLIDLENIYVNINKKLLK
ncbi:MAG: hypothetical protein AAE985_06920 [Thermoplasmataceae archaeon]